MGELAALFEKTNEPFKQAQQRMPETNTARVDNEQFQGLADRHLELVSRVGSLGAAAAAMSNGIREACALAQNAHAEATQAKRLAEAGRGLGHDPWQSGAVAAAATAAASAATACASERFDLSGSGGQRCDDDDNSHN